MNPASLRRMSFCLSAAFGEKETLIPDCSSLLAALATEPSGLKMSFEKSRTFHCWALLWWGGLIRGIGECLNSREETRQHFEKHIKMIGYTWINVFLVNEKKNPQLRWRNQAPGGKSPKSLSRVSICWRAHRKTLDGGGSQDESSEAKLPVHHTLSTQMTLSRLKASGWFRWWLLAARLSTSQFFSAFAQKWRCTSNKTLQQHQHCSQLGVTSCFSPAGSDFSPWSFPPLHSKRSLAV